MSGSGCSRRERRQRPLQRIFDVLLWKAAETKQQGAEALLQMRFLVEGAEKCFRSSVIPPLMLLSHRWGM